MINKYKYFIPVIGLLLLVKDIYFTYNNSILDKHYDYHNRLSLFLRIKHIAIDVPLITIIILMLLGISII